MTYSVTLIPGDGIGPELATATVTVLEATGLSFDWRPVDAGESQIAIHGTPLPEQVLDSIRETKVALKGPDHDTRRRWLPQRQRDAPPGARPVCQPAPGAVDEGRRDALRERRPDHRAREHGRPVRGHRAHGRPRRGGEHQDHHPRRVRADCALRVRLRGGQRPAQGHRRAQGQHHEAVRRPFPGVVPHGRRATTPARSSSRTASSTTCACSSSRSRSCTTCSCCPTCTATSSATCAPAWSAAWASRRGPTSARRRPCSSRSMAPRPSTPARTSPTPRP